MFTGIVQATGRIAARDGAADGVRVRIDAAALGVADIAVGDSIAVGGCCLTVVAINAHVLAFDVSAETLACTAGFDVGREVNLEKSLRLSDRLGGHLVSGHVDGVGVVAAFAAVSADAQGSWYLSIDAPVALARYIASKGSIAVDGVSLTVSRIDDASFDVSLIPETLERTNLGGSSTGRSGRSR